jgi:hypothetical protein
MWLHHENPLTAFPTELALGLLNLDIVDTVLSSSHSLERDLLVQYGFEFGGCLV